MVDVNTVYQKVLALANKEQRGYITPQEFNLLADKAQLELFDSYFHDIKTAYHKPQNQMGVAFDEIEMMQEKLQPFRSTSTITNEADDATLTLPSTLYRIDTVSRTEGEVVELSKKEILLTQNNPLTKATINRTVYVRETSGQLTLYPTPLVETSFEIQFFAEPTTPNWAYVIVNEKALYNSNLSTNFQLHISEEENLVSRILQLAGVVIVKPEIVQVGMTERASTKQEQND